MEEFEAILEGLAEKYDRQFEQLDVNIAFEALGSTPPKDCSECPVHSRVNVHDYNPTAGIEAMYAEYQKRGGKVHPNGALQTKPWGTKEFGAIDPNGVCVTFQE